MFLQKVRKKQAQILKQCSYPGCNQRYWGISVSKYCDECSSLPHKKTDTVFSGIKVLSDIPIVKKCIQYKCAVGSCPNIIDTVLYPQQTVYALYCEEHRTKWRMRNV